MMPWWAQILAAVVTGGIGMKLVEIWRLRRERGDQVQDQLADYLRKELGHIRDRVTRMEERERELIQHVAECEADRAGLKAETLRLEGEIEGLRERLDRRG